MSGAAIAALFTVLVAAALTLFLGGRRDHRARLFGLWFLLSASAFADTLIGFLPAAWPVVGSLGRAIQLLPLDAFLPLVLWAFVADFPRVRTFRSSRTVRVMTRVSLAVGLGLFVLNLALSLVPSLQAAGPAALLDRQASDGLYHPLVMLLSLAALVHSLRRARRAPADERRRVALLLFGIAVGILPITLVVTAQGLIPAFYAWSISSPRAWVLQVVVYVPLLAMPLIAAYAVYTRGALDVRLVVRAALRYALARGTVAALAVVPFLALAVLLYRNREARLVDLLAGSAGLPLLGAAVAGLVALRVREPLLEALDRRFYRDRYDARRILGRLIHASRQADSLVELSGLLRSELDAALHLHAFALLVHEPEQERFSSVGRTIRALPDDSPLVQLVARADEGVRVDLLGRRPQPAGLPPRDREWLLDAGSALLVPVRGDGGSLLGILSLGDRRGELPFTAEDTALLADIGIAVGVSLENRRLRSASAHSHGPGADRSVYPWGEDAALECTACGHLADPDEARCPRCGGALTEGVLPALLGDKFRVEARIGQGGMGVVYRATDVALDRPVAIKALPPVGVRHAARLRAEARAMAAVSHPNLAPIYGAESWNGQPLLVVEYLAGGTLADRLRTGPLGVEATLSMAAALARGVEALHRQGILHRDIKPSNVGLTRDGHPKLLDFGLARLSDTGGLPDPGVGPSPRELDGEPDAEPSALRSGIVGTTLYLSPEALRGARPDPSFDLWSLTVLLQECLSGRNPFWKGSLAGAMARILAAEPRDVREDCPDCPEALVDLVRRGLAADPRRRPRTATEFRQRLDAAAEGLRSVAA